MSDTNLETQAYDVHANTVDSELGHAETLLVDNCSTAEEAREEALSLDRVNDIEHVEPHVERVELAIQGTTDAIAEYLEAVDNASVIDGIDVKGRDPDEALVSFSEEGGIPTFGVESWRDVVMRVTGLADHLGDGDGIDMAADQVARDDSTVDIIIGDETVARVVQTEQSWSAEVSTPDA